MPHQLLDRLDIFPTVLKKSCKGPPKRVPPYSLFDADPFCGGLNKASEGSFRPVRLLALVMWACEYPVIRLVVG